MDYDGEIVSIWPGCWRRGVFDKVGLFNEAFPRTEDIDFNSRLRQAGYKVWLSPKIRAWYFCRGTLRELWRQNWSNGRGVVDTLPLNPRAIRPHHLIPMFFILSLLILGIAGVFLKPLWLFLGLELGLYIGLSFFFSLNSAMGLYRLSVPEIPGFDFPKPGGGLPFGFRNSKALTALWLPLVFATLHASYGLGSLARLISWPFGRKSGGNAERGRVLP